jgi:hypothetical protein
VINGYRSHRGPARSATHLIGTPSCAVAEAVPNMKNGFVEGATASRGSCATTTST